MKTTLNIIIALLIFLIWSDIDNNSVLKQTNYDNSFIGAGALTIAIFIRSNINEFKKLFNDHENRI